MAARPGGGGEARAKARAANLAMGMAWVLVTADGAPSNEPVVAIEGRVIHVTLASSKPSEHAELNRALRGLGLIRPLMWLEDPPPEARVFRSHTPLTGHSLCERGPHCFQLVPCYADAGPG